MLPNNAACGPDARMSGPDLHLSEHLSSPASSLIYTLTHTPRSPVYTLSSESILRNKVTHYYNELLSITE